MRIDFGVFWDFLIWRELPEKVLLPCATSAKPRFFETCENTCGTKRVSLGFIEYQPHQDGHRIVSFNPLRQYSNGFNPERHDGYKKMVTIVTIDFCDTSHSPKFDLTTKDHLSHTSKKTRKSTIVVFSVRIS